MREPLLESPLVEVGAPTGASRPRTPLPYEEPEASIVPSSVDEELRRKFVESPLPAVQELELELDILQKARDTGQITEEDYERELENLGEQYIAEGGEGY